MHALSTVQPTTQRLAQVHAIVEKIAGVKVPKRTEINGEFYKTNAFLVMTTNGNANGFFFQLCDTDAGVSLSFESCEAHPDQ